MDAKISKNYKFECCKPELASLLKKLLENNYGLTAETIYDHIANTGVETDLNPELKNQMSMEEFLKSQ